MNTKEKVRELYAAEVGCSFARAAGIWKGYGPLGQQPYGWWLEPIGRNARFIGSSLADVRARGLGHSGLREVESDEGHNLYR